VKHGRYAIIVLSSIIFDRALTTAQLESKEATRWGNHHQEWPENDLASLEKRRFRPLSGASSLSRFYFCGCQVIGQT